MNKNGYQDQNNVVQNHTPNSTHQIRRFADGTIQMTDTLPKPDYYRSLRRPLNSPTENDPASPHGLASQISLDIHQRGTLKSVRGKKNILDYKPSGQEEKCYVLMLEGVEKSFTIDRNAYGIHLFEKVCRELDLRETEYFGMTFRGCPRTDYWLKMDRRLHKQLEKHPWKLEFHIRYYPVDIDELKDDLTRYFLCLQIRQDIISGQLPCSFHTYVALGAYVVQSEAGDYDPATHVGTDYIASMPFAPQALQSPQMLHRIVELHKLHLGQTPVQADRGFLENARRLALYGVEFHRAKTPTDENISVGVYHSGILIYRGRVRLTRIPWALMVKLSHRGKIFILTIRNVNLPKRLSALFPPKATSPGSTAGFLHTIRRQPSEEEAFNQLYTLNFHFNDSRLATKLWDSCTSQHAFFRLRESPGPQRANLTNAFTSRKYHVFDRHMGTTNSLFTPTDWLGRPPPVIQRVPTQRKPQQYASTPWMTPVVTRRSSDSSAPVASSEELDQSYILPTSPQSIHLEPMESNLYTTQPPVYGKPGPARPALAEDHWRMSPSDCTSGLGMNNDGTDVAAMPKSDWQGCRANRGVRWPGAYFYEAMLLEEGAIRLGWSTNSASLILGTDSKGFGYGSDDTIASKPVGLFFYGNVAQEYGIHVVPQDVIGCYLELSGEDHQVSVQWSHNGQLLGPAVFTTPYALKLDDALFPTVSLKDARVAFNFGNKPYRFPPKHATRNGHPWLSLAQVPSDLIHANRNVGWRVNPQRMTSKEHLLLSANGRMVQAAVNAGWQGFRTNKGIFGNGKYYYEVRVLEASGLARVGFAFEGASLNLGSDSLGYGYGGGIDDFNRSGVHAVKSHAGVEENYGATFGMDDVIGCFLDLDTGAIQWSKNGRMFGNAFWIPEKKLQDFDPIFPAVSLMETTLELNFGDQPFEFPPESDWLPVFAAPDENIIEFPIDISTPTPGSPSNDLSLSCPEPPIRTTSRRVLPNETAIVQQTTDHRAGNIQLLNPESPIFDETDEDEVHTFTGKEIGESNLDWSASTQQPSNHMRRPSFTQAMTDRSEQALASEKLLIIHDSPEEKMFNDAIMKTTMLDPQVMVMVESVQAERARTGHRLTNRR